MREQATKDNRNDKPRFFQSPESVSVEGSVEPERSSGTGLSNKANDDVTPNSSAPSKYSHSFKSKRTDSSNNVSTLTSLLSDSAKEKQKDLDDKLITKETKHTSSRNSPTPSGSVSHGVIGSDVTREIYQWAEKRQSLNIRRRMSDSELSTTSHSAQTPVVLRASDLRQPGMFRRHYLSRDLERRGIPSPSFITTNFIDFLTLYGTFGGDVVPEEDTETDSENTNDSLQSPSIGDEESPLIRRSTGQKQVKGTSAKKAFFMLMKAFVGTGVLFLPKAFSQGGLGFSVILIVFIGWLTLHCMLLLVETSREIGGSFGDIGEKLYGPRTRKLVLASIALSQMGFCCAYYIFVAQNLRDVVMIASDCTILYPEWVYILLQFLVYFPLSWIRKIKHFSFTSLIADVFILLGLGYIVYFNLIEMAVSGIAPKIIWFNMNSFSLFVGTALFAFEGICLILPIADSMEKPEKFGKTLTWCIICVGATFIFVGASGYLTFGHKVGTIIFMNLPKQSPVVTGLQLFYAIAIILSFPLTVYPVIRITEQSIFGNHTGKLSLSIKWQKNMYRAGLVLFLAAVAYLGADNLDKFVSLVGCFACIPLSFVYPALFHANITKNVWTRRKDILIVVFGLLATMYTTWVTIQQWVSAGPDIPIDRCKASRMDSNGFLSF